MGAVPWTVIGISGVPLLVLLAVVFLLTRTVDNGIQRTVERLKASLELERAEREAALTRESERWSRIFERRSSIDLDLRAKREVRYLSLWRLGEDFRLYPRNSSLTYEDVVALSDRLREWYFDGGGMYLSQEARDRYMDLQETLAGLAAAPRTGVLTEPDYERGRSAFSALRTELTRDLQSRVRVRDPGWESE